MKETGQNNKQLALNINFSIQKIQCTFHHKSINGDNSGGDHTIFLRQIAIKWVRRKVYRTWSTPAEEGFGKRRERSRIQLTSVEDRERWNSGWRCRQYLRYAQGR